MSAEFTNTSLVWVKTLKVQFCHKSPRMRSFFDLRSGQSYSFLTAWFFKWMAIGTTLYQKIFWVLVNSEQHYVHHLGHFHSQSRKLRSVMSVYHLSQLSPVYQVRIITALLILCRGADVLPIVWLPVIWNKTNVRSTKKISLWLLRHLIALFS